MNNQELSMKVKTFFDNNTSTFTYIVIDEKTKHCAVIDSVLDYDQDAAMFKTTSADNVIDYIKKHDLKNLWILETHIHADHITGAFYLKQHIGGKTAIGSSIKKVLKMWVPLFDTSHDTPITGAQFDHLFEDKEHFKIGNLTAEVFHTPGHTPACSTYHIENAVFVGDTLFAPNLGTARVDFPGGNANDLYDSIQRIFTLPDETNMYLCHDYPSQGVEPLSQTTIGVQKSSNKMLSSKTTLEEFVKLREARDKTLNVPKLILPSIQTNMRLGDFGAKSGNGIQYLKIPINILNKKQSQMKINQLSDVVAVSPQLIEADIAELKAQGFKSIICNRPDGEEPDQSNYKEIENQALRLGMNFRNLPVLNTQVSAEEIDKFKNLLHELPTPILAYCRTGTRCATLWSLSQVNELSKTEILTKTKKAGYDMTSALNRIL